MVDFKITPTGDGSIAIYAPYNPAFVKQIKSAGAKWSAGKSAWVTDERNIDAARQVMRDVYGRDDQPADLVSVKITLPLEIDQLKGSIVMLGRTIASAKSRDGGAKVQAGVSITGGEAKSGGSALNWRTVITAGSVITMHDIPRAAVESRLGLDQYEGRYDKDPRIGLEIINVFGSGKTALRKEKERLLVRLAEIEKELEG